MCKGGCSVVDDQQLVIYDLLPDFDCSIDRTLTPYEPRHDKTKKVTVRPAKTQNILGMRPAWSESSLCA